MEFVTRKPSFWAYMPKNPSIEAVGPVSRWTDFANPVRNFKSEPHLGQLGLKKGNEGPPNPIPLIQLSFGFWGVFIFI
jgi:hypothetical protein